MALADEQMQTARQFVRRFDGKAAIKSAKKYGIQFDSGDSGISAVSTDIEPVEPDTIRDMTGAENADYWMDIDVTGKELLQYNTKAGHIEYKIRCTVLPEDIVAFGKTQKSRDSPSD